MNAPLRTTGRRLSDSDRKLPFPVAVAAFVAFSPFTGGLVVLKNAVVARWKRWRRAGRAGAFSRGVEIG